MSIPKLQSYFGLFGPKNTREIQSFPWTRGWTNYGSRLRQKNLIGIWLNYLSWLNSWFTGKCKAFGSSASINSNIISSRLRDSGRDLALSDEESEWWECEDDRLGQSWSSIIVCKAGVERRSGISTPAFWSVPMTDVLESSVKDKYETSFLWFSDSLTKLFGVSFLSLCGMTVMKDLHMHARFSLCPIKSGSCSFILFFLQDDQNLASLCRLSVSQPTVPILLPRSQLIVPITRQIIWHLSDSELVDPSMRNSVAAECSYYCSDHFEWNWKIYWDDSSWPIRRFYLLTNGDLIAPGIKTQQGSPNSSPIDNWRLFTIIIIILYYRPLYINIYYYGSLICLIDLEIYLLRCPFHHL